VSDWASALSWGRDEADLVHELQAGSETAFDWLVTHYHAPVYNLILGMLGDTSDAADGAQEVFLKAFRGIRNFRQGSSLKTWLYRIAIREALNHKRWFKRHLQKNVSIDAEPVEGQARIEIEDLGATPFEQLASLEIQAVVHGALQQVPDVFRSAVILRDLEGLSYEEVSEVLECSVGTVKSRILRGRRALKEILSRFGLTRDSRQSRANVFAWQRFRGSAVAFWRCIFGRAASDDFFRRYVPAGKFHGQGCPMKCNTVRTKLAGYLDDAVTGGTRVEERVQIRQHLEGCGICREELERFRKLAVMLSRVPRNIPPAVSPCASRSLPLRRSIRRIGRAACAASRIAPKFCSTTFSAR